jgi:translation initiation factor 1
MSNRSDKRPTDGGQALGQNPFASLSGLSLPTAHSSAQALPGDRSGAKAASASSAGATAAKANAEPARNRGRVDITREKAGRGGKTVTVVSGFVGIGLPEKEQLAKKMQKACGTGGTVKEGRIEIQGDRRDEIARILAEAGFRPVFAGG